MSSRSRSSKLVSAGFRADLASTWRDLSKHTSAGHKWAVLFIILVGIVLRAVLLNRPIGQEEAFVYVEFASRPVGELISNFAHPTNHILHTLLTKWSTALFGVGLIQLRLPAFLAGVLVLPLFYLFVRGMFNRYIALLTLALVAGSGPLIEYSAMARGFSITWLCMVLALALGRHVIKVNSAVSALLISMFLSLGMWTMPSMGYVAILVYAWLLLSLTIKYDNTLRPRLNVLLLSFAAFVLLSALLYLPVIRTHGLDQITHHPLVPYLNWRQFKRGHEEMAFQLWAYLVDSSSTWMAVLGLGGLVQAAFVSSKFRTLGFALLIGAVPPVLLMKQIIPPQQWLYALFIFHLSSGIALFYLLKFVQEKVFSGLGKRTRTMATAVVLLSGFGWSGMRTAWQRTEGMPEAARAVTYASASLKVGDKLYAMFPWDAPIEFHMMSAGLDAEMLYGTPAPTGEVFIAVATLPEQEPMEVLRHHGQDPERWPDLEMVQDWPGMRIFAAR